jgi:hypothetical protein
MRRHDRTAFEKNSTSLSSLDAALNAFFASQSSQHAACLEKLARMTLPRAIAMRSAQHLPARRCPPRLGSHQPLQS